MIRNHAVYVGRNMEDLHLQGHLTGILDEGRIMNEKETLMYIEELKKYGSVPGLTNIRNLCEKLGHPERELSCTLRERTARDLPFPFFLRS